MQDLRADPSGFKGRQKLLYQILGDGAKMAQGFKALSIAGRLMRHQGQPGSEVWMHQSPSKLQELVMSKGRDDDYNILGTYPCPWCHMSKGQLHEGTLGRVVHDLRTLEDMRKMAPAYGHNMRPVMQGSLLDALRGFWKEVARPFEDDGVEGSPVRQGVADRVKAAAIKASDQPYSQSHGS
eukprot:jgi/Mesvir1/17690/Mv07870-RA.1